MGIPRARLRWLLSTTLICLAVGGLYGQSRPAAQTAPPAPQSASSQPAGPVAGDFRVRVDVELVQVDVRVTRKGQPVTDLRREDFRIFEDGVEQEVAAFSREQVPEYILPVALEPARTTAAPGAPTPVEGPPVASTVPYRLIGVYFARLRGEDRLRALEATQRFVRDKMTASDYVALLLDSGMAQNFTNRKETLLDALKRIEERRDLASEATGPGDVAVAEGVTAQDVLGGSAESQAGESSVPSDLLAVFSGGLQSVSGMEEEFFVNSVLQNLEAIVTGLRALPGKKSLVMYVPGLPMNAENRHALRRAVDRANRANVTVYTVDARGLIEDVPMGEARAQAPSQVRGRLAMGGRTGAILGDQVFAQQDRRVTEQISLREVAEGTGGKAFTSSEDVGRVFTQVLEDSGFYYLLAYRSKNPARDGRYHKIEVQVARDAVKVQARPGYYAAKGFQELTPVERQLRLREALLTERPFAEIPFRIGLAHFRLPDNKYFLSLTYSLPMERVPHETRGSRAHVQLSFYSQAVATRGTGAFGASDALRFETAPASFSDEHARREPALEYLTRLVVPPGQFRLKCVVQDELGGQLGTLLQDIYLPPLKAPGNDLDTSSLVVSGLVTPVPRPTPSAALLPDPAAPPDAEPNPLIVGEAKIIPAVERQFRADAPVYVFFQVYDLPVGSGGQPALMYQVAILRGGELVRALPPLTIGEYTDAGRKLISAAATVSLADLPPGDYTLAVIVADQVSGRQKKLEEAFRLAPPPAETGS